MPGYPVPSTRGPAGSTSPSSPSIARLQLRQSHLQEHTRPTGLHRRRHARAPRPRCPPPTTRAQFLTGGGEPLPVANDKLSSCACADTVPGSTFVSWAPSEYLGSRSLATETPGGNPRLSASQSSLDCSPVFRTLVMVSSSRAGATRHASHQHQLAIGACQRVPDGLQFCSDEG